MAAPTKVDVLAELKALGIEASEDQKMPELLELLKGAREGAGAGDGVKPPETPAPTAGEAPTAARAPRTKTVEIKTVMLTNVTHNGTFYKRGTEPELDDETLALFISKGFIAE